VDGPRNYQDESDGRWYPSFPERYPEPEGRYDEDRYRAPEPRYSDEPSGDPGRYRDPRPDPLTDPALSSRPVGPRSGVELPPPLADPAERFGESRFGTESMDRSALRRPPGGGSSGPGPVGAGPAAPPPAPPGVLPAMPTVAAESVGGAIYRTRRVGVAALLGAVAIVAELLLVRVLVSGEFGHTVQPGAVLAGIFAMCGVPLVTMGLYGLMTGAATAGGPTPGRAWLRTPLAYLPVGLALMIAAGLAA
jgi:hypothetical protein